MTLRLLTFGGTIYDNQNAGSGTPVDVWSNSIALASTEPGEPTQAECDACASIISAWFENASTGIAATAALEFVKLNTVDMVSGLQVTDPTVESVINPQKRGGSDNANPVTTCYRVSIDDSTRSRTHRGGFYPPRAGHAVGTNGRWSQTDTTNRLTQAQTMLQALNNLSWATVAIWSRKDNVLHPANRVRVSDVPDNMSSRKNALLPTRVFGLIT